MNLTAELKEALQRRYDLTLPWEIEPFICHDRAQITAAAGAEPGAFETLFVRADEDALSVSLFLDHGLLHALARGHCSWRQAWHGHHFSGYCTVLEGVSHLVYLLWSATHGRALSRRDLELQAEVDKFAVSALDTRIEPAQAARLPARLYDDVDYLDDAPRYREANRLARRYCHHLRKRYVVASDNGALRAELARFYRMSGGQKRRHIHALH